MDQVPPEPFGQALRRMREAAGQTQERLAECAGLSVRGISDIERGVRTTPRLETVHMLADGLGLDEAQRSELLTIRNAALHNAAGSVRSVSAVLPTPRSSFIGRGREIESIVTTLRRENVRLLTLIGPGGIGKTRISIEVAHRLEDEYTHGAVFVDISPIRSPEMVLVTIATRLGLREQPGADLKSVLQVALQNRTMLLILDNLEQVLGAAPDIAWLLEICPRLNILATSRVVLRIAAEHIYEIEPMQIIREGAVRESEAILLFMERATAANSQFALHDENAVAVIEVVSRLQGMPLAIELASARIRLWPVAELLRRLDTQLTVLAGGAVDSPDRHRSLRDTIAWSYDLLTPRDQAVFRAMSIFPVGCTMDTAVKLLQAHKNLSEDHVMKAIGTLVDSSLVRLHEGVDQCIRYGMLVSVREFGLEQLEVCEESASMRWAAHQAWAEPVALRAELASFEKGAVEHLKYLDEERQNFDEHIDWLIQHNEVLTALNLYGLLSSDRWLRGSNEKSRRKMEALLADPRAQTHSLERLRGLIGLMSDYEGVDDFRLARHYMDAAESLARELNDLNSLVRVLSAQMINRRVTGDLEGTEHYRRELNAIAMRNDIQWALSLETGVRAQIFHERGDLITASRLISQATESARKSGSLFLESRGKVMLGYYLMLLNRLEEAEEMKLQAHQQLIELRDLQALPVSLSELSEVARLRGNGEQAREYAERGLRLAHDTGSMRGIAAALNALAQAAGSEEDWVTARRYYHESMYWAERCNLHDMAVRCLEYYAKVELASGSPAFAAWCLGAVDGLFERNGTMRSGLVHSQYVDLLERVKESLDAHEWSSNYDTAKQMSVDEVLKEVKNRAIV